MTQPGVFGRGGLLDRGLEKELGHNVEALSPLPNYDVGKTNPTKKLGISDLSAEECVGMPTALSHIGLLRTLEPKHPRWPHGFGEGPR